MWTKRNTWLLHLLLLNIIFNHDYYYDLVFIITPCYWIQFQNTVIVVKLKLRLGIFCDNFGNFWKSLTISLSCFVSFCIRGTASEPILHRCFRHKCTFTPTRTSSPKSKMCDSQILTTYVILSILEILMTIKYFFYRVHIVETPQSFYERLSWIFP